MDRIVVRFTLNGEDREASVWPHRTLLHLLHDELGVSEVRYGCGEGVCATCTVLVDGESVNSCLFLAVQVDGRAVTTVGGLGRGDELHPLQESFLRHGASQCGFCTPGMLLSAVEFVDANPSPSRDEIRRALAGNLCRCTGYTKIVDAVEAYARARERELPRSAPGDGGG